MGFRFYRRIRILPGVRINLSRSGVSTSIGGRGAWLTFGKRGTRATICLPGTGISYTQTVRPRSEQQPGAQPPGQPGSAVGAWLLLFLALLAIAAGIAWLLSVGAR